MWLKQSFLDFSFPISKNELDNSNLIGLSSLKIWHYFDTEICGASTPPGSLAIFLVKTVCEVLTGILRYKPSAAMETLNSTQSNILRFSR